MCRKENFDNPKFHFELELPILARAAHYFSPSLTVYVLIEWCLLRNGRTKHQSSKMYWSLNDVMFSRLSKVVNGTFCLIFARRHKVINYCVVMCV